MQRHLRFPRLQGAQQDLLHHPPDRRRHPAHHTARHGQLQREDGEALHRPVAHHNEPHNRPRCDGVLPQHGARERVGQLRRAVGGAPAGEAAHSEEHRPPDRACSSRRTVWAVLQDELGHRQGDHRQDRRGIAGRREDRHARSRDIMPGPRRGRLHRERARRLDRGTHARA